MVSFIITGFGPFSGVQENPTSVLVAKLIDYLLDSENDGDCASSGQRLAAVTRTLLIETSANAAKEQVDEIFRELSAAPIQESSSSLSSDVESRESVTFLIHLGVNSMASSFALETCAFNDATFSCPDEQRYQPCNVPIVPGSYVGSRLETSIDVPTLVDHLNSTRSDSQSTDDLVNSVGTFAKEPIVVVSNDAGRFVCNYTYCYSLDKFQSSQKKRIHEPNTVTGPSSVPHVKCLFLHVPPFSITPEREQLRFVVDLMLALESEEMKSTR